jgi:hypothetical protein
MEATTAKPAGAVAAATAAVSASGSAPAAGQAKGPAGKKKNKYPHLPPMQQLRMLKAVALVPAYCSIGSDSLPLGGKPKGKDSETGKPAYHDRDTQISRFSTMYSKYVAILLSKGSRTKHLSICPPV